MNSRILCAFFVSSALVLPSCHRRSTGDEIPSIGIVPSASVTASELLRLAAYTHFEDLEISRVAYQFDPVPLSAPLSLNHPDCIDVHFFDEDGDGTRDRATASFTNCANILLDEIVNGTVEFRGTREAASIQALLGAGCPELPPLASLGPPSLGVTIEFHISFLQPGASIPGLLTGQLQWIKFPSALAAVLQGNLLLTGLTSADGERFFAEADFCLQVDLADPTRDQVGAVHVELFREESSQSLGTIAYHLGEGETIQFEVFDSQGLTTSSHGQIDLASGQVQFE